MKAILTSSLGGQIKVDGKRIPAKLMENNGLPDSLSGKRQWQILRGGI